MIALLFYLYNIIEQNNLITDYNEFVVKFVGIVDDGDERGGGK